MGLVVVGAAVFAIVAHAVPPITNEPASPPITDEPASPPTGTTTGAWPPPRPRLAPYLSTLNLWGGGILQPGALVASDPLSSTAASIKSELARVGINYALYQSFQMAAMSDRIQGDAVISAYSFEMLGSLSLFHLDALGGTDAWIAAEFDGGQGLGIDWTTQSPDTNIGAMTATDYVWWADDIFISQLSWAQSFLDGRLVVIAGVVDQTNYFDTNAYANSGFGQLQNRAFVESQVLPDPAGTLGFNIQWQPVDCFYLLVGASANRYDGSEAFNSDLSPRDLSALAEIGFVVPDVAGLGPGTYRIQPFVVSIDGDMGGGVGFNFQQQLGAKSPLGLFGRFGIGTETTAASNGAGAVAQASGGLALLSPFADKGPFSAANNDYAAIAFKWTRAPSSPFNIHDDEFALEATYAMQLTPTAVLQPDLQLVWDPASSPRDFAVVFQLSINLRW
ncbi:MAG: carbohydrate porin [Phycisphaerae bacterium]|nr:carbohydrate porin [Phycisphaerae bacterium]